MRSELRSSPPTLGADGAAAGEVSARGPRRRRPRRVTAGVAVPVVLGVLAAGFAYEALQSRSATTDVVVARSTVVAGAPVDSADTRAVKVRSEDRSLLRDMVPPSEMEEGWVAAVPIRAGEPVTSSELSRPAKGPRLGQMSIAVPVDEAVGGRLTTGDRVDVISSNAEGSAYYVAQGLEVLAVAQISPDGALLGSSTSYYVVVAVGKQTALHIAAALGAQAAGGSGAGGVELVRSSGEPATERTSYSLPAASSAPSSQVPKGGR